MPVSLVKMDYAWVISFLGVNYLATRSPQMLWSYVLLTVTTLPQDAAEMAQMSQWVAMDLIERAAHMV